MNEHDFIKAFAGHIESLRLFFGRIQSKHGTYHAARAMKEAKFPMVTALQVLVYR
jgi:hypothetical protein